ncbi:tyrosine-type recombinase/integrase [Sphingobium sp.]|uniref:tyrosine-type recombinase/integrase n=1 Tax=Sphingobium sp. TaxID=1912891 RepID=UPI0025D7ADA4|nr:tyrosine-type recombinase/integrase [Sphingobium sp.]
MHPALSWLAERAAGKSSGRVWPQFNEEGPGKKAGADAGREFSRLKQARGFNDRRKVFHSFRKNFVGQLEEAGIPANEVAQLVGHEKVFTFKTYGKTVSLARMASIVAMIAYPGVNLPSA